MLHCLLYLIWFIVYAESLDLACQARPCRLTGRHCPAGPTYCGVIGHPARHEYTVIGRTVNKAARLMTNYPGVVSCDEVRRT